MQENNHKLPSTEENTQSTNENQSFTQLLLDLGPLAVFFITYKTAGIIAATGALVAATLASLIYTYIKTKKIAPMPLLTGVLVTIFGLLTIYLNDELFIKMKPTFVNLLFAAILLGGLAFKKPLLKAVLGSSMKLEEKAWWILSKRWGLFFIFLAGLNEYIWRNYPTDFWVNFKVFGMFTITLAFTFAQIPLIKKYLIEE